MASLSIADMSPRLALQRILALFEKGEQREAAAFLNRLSVTTFRQVLPDLPTDLFVESLPQVSLPNQLPSFFTDKSADHPIDDYVINTHRLYILMTIDENMPAEEDSVRFIP